MRVALPRRTLANFNLYTPKCKSLRPPNATNALCYLVHASVCKHASSRQVYEIRCQIRLVVNKIISHVDVRPSRMPTSLASVTKRIPPSSSQTTKIEDLVEVEFPFGSSSLPVMK